MGGALKSPQLSSPNTEALAQLSQTPILEGGVLVVTVHLVYEVLLYARHLGGLLRYVLQNKKVTKGSPLS